MYPALVLSSVYPQLARGFGLLTGLLLEECPGWFCVAGEKIMRGGAIIIFTGKF